jgi:glycosyltransferase involved in cell wall biosynthesis
MAKIKLSVVLAVRNEELNIGRCLESVKGIADQIIVVDEKSIDKTVTIAKEYKAKVIEVEHSDNFHVSKKYSN